MVNVSSDLRDWVELVAEDAREVHPELSDEQILNSVLSEFEECGDAMRHLNRKGQVSWRATPRFLSKLSDLEQDAISDGSDF